MNASCAAEIACRLKGELVGDGTVVIDGINSLEDATASQLSFFSHPRYRQQVLTSGAGAVLVPRDFAEPPPAGRAFIRCANPSLAFSQAMTWFCLPPVVPPPGIHPTATVAPTARLGQQVHVGPHAVIEAGAVIGDGTAIEAGTYVGQETVIGSQCRLYPNVSVRERCRLGNRVIVHCGAVIGSDGFGYEPNPAGHIKLPQLGIVQIDDDVEIGAGTTVDRARFGRTWIQRHTKIDNLVQIAHNVTVGEGCFLMAQSGVAGSARLGRFVALFGQAGVPGHCTLGDQAMIMGHSGPISDVAPGAKLFGMPALPHAEALRAQVVFRRLPALDKQVRALEARLAALERQLGTPPAAGR